MWHESCLIAWKSMWSYVFVWEHVCVEKKCLHLSSMWLHALYSIFEEEEIHKKKERIQNEESKKETKCMILISFKIVLRGAYLYLKSLWRNSWIPVTRIIIFSSSCSAHNSLKFPFSIAFKRIEWAEKEDEFWKK